MAVVELQTNYSSSIAQVRTEDLELRLKGLLGTWAADVEVPGKAGQGHLGLIVYQIPKTVQHQVLHMIRYDELCMCLLIHHAINFQVWDSLAGWKHDCSVTVTRFVLRHFILLWILLVALTSCGLAVKKHCLSPLLLYFLHPKCMPVR